MFYSIEAITGDNRRPGMPEQGFIIRYGVSDYGWKYQKCFNTIEEVRNYITESIKEKEA